MKCLDCGMEMEQGTVQGIGQVVGIGTNLLLMKKKTGKLE